MDTWRDQGRIDPFMIAWPAEDLLDDNGQLVTDNVVMPLEGNRAEWPLQMHRLVQRTKPYGLLLVEQRDKEVVIIFESMHGSVSWHYPIIKTGNRFLGQLKKKEDTESIGILWRAKRAQA